MDDLNTVNVFFNEMRTSPGTGDFSFTPLDNDLYRSRPLPDETIEGHVEVVGFGTQAEADAFACGMMEYGSNYCVVDEKRVSPELFVLLVTQTHDAWDGWTSFERRDLRNP